MKIQDVKTTMSIVLTFLALQSQIFAKEIVKPFFDIPIKWENANILLLKHDKDTIAFDVKTGVRTKFQTLVKVNEISVLVKSGDLWLKNINGVEERLTNTESIEKIPSISPDNSKVVFVRENDLYVINLLDRKIQRITFDGSSTIYNGYASWVYYEEIFGRASNYKAYWWSEDSNKLLFYRFDDTEVPTYTITDFKGQHPTLTVTRYPKAGDNNPKVRVGIYNLNSNNIVWSRFDENEDQYFGTPFWSKSNQDVIIQWMNRDQNTLKLYSINSLTGEKIEIYSEKQHTWVDWISETLFGENGFYFVRDFEKWEEIYFLNYNGGAPFKLSEGKNWGIKLLNLDLKESRIYYTSRKEASVRSDIYLSTWNKNFKDLNTTLISSGKFNYSMPLVSPDGKNIAAIESNLVTPPRSVLISFSGKTNKIRLLDESRGADFNADSIPLPKLLYLTTSEGFTIPATLILPKNLIEGKKYPVIINMYGGPNSATVFDIWRTPSQISSLWYNEGVIQVNMDHRASGHCGREGMDQIYRNLGEVELNDYIEWVKYLRRLPYVDPQKIGITGFSYGGTMTLLALTDGADYFQFGIAGGGVYDWSLYDSHYTEKFMGTPQNNPKGYAKSSVLSKVSKYTPEKGSLLRITHGTSDDNVHLQNTIQLISAFIDDNKHFELTLYPGGFHGYRGKQAKHSADEDIMFWKRVLLNK